MRRATRGRRRFGTAAVLVGQTFGLLAVCAGVALAAANPIPADTDQQAAQRQDIRINLSIDQVNDLRASCAEGTRKTPAAGDLPLGEQCLEALTRSIGEGYARDYYAWEYRAIAQAAKKDVAPTNAITDKLASQIDAAAQAQSNRVNVAVGDQVLAFPILRSRAFDAAYVMALRNAKGDKAPAKSAMSDATLRQTTQSCYSNHADVSLSQCRDAAREFARRALLRAGAGNGG